MILLTSYQIVLAKSSHNYFAILLPNRIRTEFPGKWQLRWICKE